MMVRISADILEGKNSNETAPKEAYGDVAAGLSPHNVSEGDGVDMLAVTLSMQKFE